MNSPGKGNDLIFIRENMLRPDNVVEFSLWELRTRFTKSKYKKFNTVIVMSRCFCQVLFLLLNPVSTSPYKMLILWMGKVHVCMRASRFVDARFTFGM